MGGGAHGDSSVNPGCCCELAEAYADERQATQRGAHRLLRPLPGDSLSSQVCGTLVAGQGRHRPGHRSARGAAVVAEPGRGTNARDEAEEVQQAEIERILSALPVASIMVDGSGAPIRVSNQALALTLVRTAGSRSRDRVDGRRRAPGLMIREHDPDGSS